ncbi:sigma-70 family RNA polymerase sigma factor [Micromonospora sp. NBC_01813]|uniref:sigma-70 family RNA polymerase sigma factor n=1 Tax=Micromonospora sp. NBC_01813 TaxID=2975988 RepID=UPI002DD8A374|nr:sigma-70 family RNA polymerase sigma factor [Micromonospora sp. NBC_01813]WSA10336.1 sigma-70 family RNA polymerase sigma factor [Micromonospora sp. NBC_01813]
MEAAPDDADPDLRLLFESQAPGLLRYLIRLTNGDRHQAEDLLQETLLRAWRHPEARARDGGWRRPWLYTVARNVAIDDLRTTRPVELTGDLLDEHPDHDDRIQRMLDVGEVRAALESLPDRLRTVLVEVYLRERSGQETARLLGVPVGTVKSRTFYALQALRERLTSTPEASHHPSVASNVQVDRH